MTLISKFKRIVLLVVFMLFTVSVCTVFASPTMYLKGTTICDVNKAYNGYVMFATKNQILLIDMDGTVINTWERLDRDLTYAKPLSNGNILAITLLRDHSGTTTLMELDWDSNVIWEYVGGDLIHHDFERLENNNTLILSLNTLISPLISPLTIFDEYIIEVNPQGEIVWEWHIVDHFDELGLKRSMKNQIASNGGDWSHINSMQSLPANKHTAPIYNKGNILVSQKHTGMLFIINKDTGKIVWKLDGLTLGQHNATMLPRGSSYEGNILVFDNGNTGDYYYPKDYRIYSRVLVIDPVSGTTLWEYNAEKSSWPLHTFFSKNMSGAQILPNGNTLIVEGANGRLFQVTSDGEIVWEYINPNFYEEDQVMKNNVYRAHLVERDWAAKSGK